MNDQAQLHYAVGPLLPSSVPELWRQCACRAAVMAAPYFQQHPAKHGLTLTAFALYAAALESDDTPDQVSAKQVSTLLASEVEKYGEPVGVRDAIDSALSAAGHLTPSEYEPSW